MESEKWFKEHKRTLEVNVSAANRFISHAIPELTNEQRSALKRVPCQPLESPCMPVLSSTPMLPLMAALLVTLALNVTPYAGKGSLHRFEGTADTDCTDSIKGECRGFLGVDGSLAAGRECSSR